MACFFNREGNILIELNLIRNTMLDYDCSRSKDENWIPFALSIKTNVVGRRSKSAHTRFISGRN